MPLQNRVTPDGDVVTTAARGTIYGNRGGCFHRDDGTLRPRQWANRQWICCVLAFKNRRRVLRQPGKFTELFFLDEATALAAGHRPCFECRRVNAEAFRSFWAKAHDLASVPSAPAMDVVLHTQRLNERGEKQIANAREIDLVDGVMVRFEGASWLIQNNHMRRWSLVGYGHEVPLQPYQKLDCLTPPATIATIRAGYRPQLHPSAAAQG